MKKKELGNLRGKKKEELKKILVDKKRQFVSILADVKAGREKNLKKAKNIKRDIAQILTIIREKELLERESGKEKRQEQKNLTGDSKEEG